INFGKQVDVDENGNLTGRPQMGDGRFNEAQSGWYWQATIIDSDVVPLTSASLGNASIELVPVSRVPFDTTFQRTYLVNDPGGVTVRVLETEFEVGGAGTAIRLQTTANFSQFRAGIDALRRNIIGVLSAFAIGLLVLNAVLIRIGLRPLSKARQQLVDVQSGKAARLDDIYPAEIEPLAEEINTLIDNNKRVVDRARTQVGNLAHALKTPIAVLRNEASAKGDVHSGLVTEQVEEMNLYVQTYLKRAQIAAQSGGAVFRSNAVTVVEKLVGVMQKLNPDKDVTLIVAPDTEITFAGEQSDLEEILGNLLENAAKWSRDRFQCALRQHNGTSTFTIEIDDDGPGIAAEKRADALKRGRRLDETVPGTGLGLSIVADTVEAYGGTLELDASNLGGLKVRVHLPVASS
ncbi:MAG: HAMP domain-containing sensor histidine kinase, partial [Pseudomonadota bacterium]